MKRCLKIFILTLAGLLAVSLVALQVVLKSDFPRAKLVQLAGNALDADVDVSTMDVRLFGTFPVLELRLGGVSVCNPCGEFPAESSDTLLFADALSLKVNLFRLAAGKIVVPAAELCGLKLHAHRYDSLTVNWDVFKAGEPAPDGENSGGFPDVELGLLRIGPDCSAVYEDEVSGIRARLDLDRMLAGIGIRSAEGQLQIGRLAMSVDSLSATVASGGDTLSYEISSLELERTAEWTFGIRAESSARLASARLPEMRVPVSLSGTLGFIPDNDGARVSVSDFRLGLDCIPLDVDGELRTGTGGLDIDAAVSLEDCPLDTLRRRYVSALYPLFSSFSTNAVLTADVSASGHLGDGEIPEFKVCVRIPDSRTVYVPNGSGFDLAADVDAVLSPDRLLDVSVREFIAGIDGLSVSVTGSASDLLGADPLYRISADAMADVASLRRFVPDSIPLTDARGALELNLKAATRQSNLTDFKFHNALIGGTLYAEDLSVALSDSVTASMFNGKLVLSSLPSGLDVQFMADSIYYNSGDETVARIRNINNHAGIEKVSSRGRYVPRMSVSTESDMIFLKVGNARYGVRGASVQASAQRRATRTRRSPRRRGRRALDVVSGVARHDLDFAAADIDISLDSSVVRYLRNWSLSGHLKADGGLMASRSLPLRTRLTALHADFDDRGIVIDTVGIRCGTSDFNLSGEVTGIKNSLIRKSRIGADLRLNSERVNVNELVAASLVGQEDHASLAPSSELDESFVTDTLSDASIDIEDLPLFIVPGNVDVLLSARVGRVDFLEPEIGPFVSGIRIKDRTMQLTSTDIDTEFGHIYADAFYSTRSKEDISAGVNLNLEEMQVDRVMQLVPLVDSLMPALRTFEGNISCELSATARLDSTMTVIMPTLDGVLRVNGRNMKLYDEGQFGKLAGRLLFDRNGVMRIDNLSADAIIHDSRLEVFPFELGIDRFKLAMQGSQGFDKSMRYHVSVLKSPLPLRFGIDLYGTVDNWKVSVGRARLSGGGIPAFTAQLDTVQLNLANSIRNIYLRNVEDVVGFNRRSLNGIYDRKVHMDEVSEEDSHQDEVAREGYAEMLSDIIYERELEDQMKETSEAVDALLEERLSDMTDLVRMNESMMFDARTLRKLERQRRRQERKEAREARREERRAERTYDLES